MSVVSASIKHNTYSGTACIFLSKNVEVYVAVLTNNKSFGDEQLNTHSVQLKYCTPKVLFCYL